MEIPAIEVGKSAVRKVGDRLIVLAPQDDTTVLGFVLDEVPPATQLNRMAQQFSKLAASASFQTGNVSDDAPNRGVRLLTRYLAKTPGRLPLRRLLSLCCDALTNSALAEEVAIVVCRPDRLFALTLSSLRLEPMRDAIADLLNRLRGEKPLTRMISPADLEDGDITKEDSIILLDKVGAAQGYISLPAIGEAGFGFLLLNPNSADPEMVCRDLRAILELKHRTQRDWSRRRSIIRYGFAAAAAAMLVFLLLPTDRIVTASGVTRPRDVQVVSLHFPSYLDHMEVEVGETLEAGAPIAILTAPDQQDARASTQYQIAVEQAAANAALAAEDYGAYVQAQSRVSLQQARLEQIEARLSLLAPAAADSGRVIAALSSGERGRHLPAGTDIARIQTGYAYVFEMRLSPSDAGLVSVGQIGELSLRGQLEQAYPISVRTPPTPDESTMESGISPTLVATAQIELQGETEIVPGLSGFAQINTGRDIRIRIWTRHIVEFIRMKAWTILNWRI